MKKYTKTSAKAVGLRGRAEEQLGERQTGQRSEVGGQITAENSLRLVHELQVHQIELEIQNEELRQSRAEAEAISDRYTDLYDFAPVGYFTLDRDGAIRGANLTGACLLGVDRSWLVNRLFGLFASEHSLPAFKAFLKKVFESQTKETCELALRKNANGPLWAHIEAVATQDGQTCRAAAVDITAHKRAEEGLKTQAEQLARSNEEMARFNRLMVGRELRLIELKQEVNELAANLGRPRPYALAFMDTTATEIVRTTSKPTGVPSLAEQDQIRAGVLVGLNIKPRRNDHVAVSRHCKPTTPRARQDTGSPGRSGRGDQRHP